MQASPSRSSRRFDEDADTVPIACRRRGEKARRRTRRTGGGHSSRAGAGAPSATGDEREEGAVAAVPPSRRDQATPALQGRGGLSQRRRHRCRGGGDLGAAPRASSRRVIRTSLPGACPGPAPVGASGARTQVGRTIHPLRRGMERVPSSARSVRRRSTTASSIAASARPHDASPHDAHRACRRSHRLRRPCRGATGPRRVGDMKRAAPPLGFAFGAIDGCARRRRACDAPWAGSASVPPRSAQRCPISGHDLDALARSRVESCGPAARWWHLSRHCSEYPGE